MDLLSGRKKLLLIVTLLVVSLALIAIFLITKGNHQSPTSSTPASTTSPATKNRSSDEPPLLLKNIGVHLDSYDPQTNKAGDFVFTKQKLQFNRLFMPYGFVIPANVTSSGQAKANPQPTYILPLGTKVLSLVDGIVANVPKLYSDDYSIQVTQNGKLEKWVYETEHVINPIVKVGDKVVAGQVIAEVSPHNSQQNPGFGIVEIGISKGGNPPSHFCPYAYLDETVKEDLFAKIKAFYSAWEDYRGQKDLYNSPPEPVPGCSTLKPIDG